MGVATVADAEAVDVHGHSSPSAGHRDFGGCISAESLGRKDTLIAVGLIDDKSDFVLTVSGFDVGVGSPRCLHHARRCEIGIAEAHSGQAVLLGELDAAVVDLSLTTHDADSALVVDDECVERGHERTELTSIGLETYVAGATESRGQLSESFEALHVVSLGAGGLP